MVKVKGEEILLSVRPFNMAREAGTSLPARGIHNDLQARGLWIALLRGFWGLGEVQTGLYLGEVSIEGI